MPSPLRLTVELEPRSRHDVIDVAQSIRLQLGDVLAPYPSALYCSHHTTAGYLEQQLAVELCTAGGGVEGFIRQFQRMFPRAAGYQHDQLELRTELTARERELEPLNGDAHLTFIGCGLQNCVTYRHHPGEPVLFMDLDGVVNGRPRRRTTSVVGFSREVPAAELRWDVPVSRHAIDSVNLYDERLGLRQAIDELLARHPVAAGRLDISLDDDESEAAVTVNEYETLLMRHDLVEVLRDPLRFVARQGRRMLSDPRTVPIKSLGYARYDVVQVINRLLDALGPAGAVVERILARAMALPAARRLRLKRSLSLAVASGVSTGCRVVRGRYQTPILIQWRPSARRARTVRVSLAAFD